MAEEAAAITRENVVIGAGMAGMACASKLYNNGRDVLLISKDVGGRVLYDPKTKCNFGAVFVMENYVRSRKILTTTTPLEVALGSLMLHTSAAKYFKGISPTMIASVPQLLKFKRFMEKDFMPEYEKFKTDCEVMEVSEALGKYPSIGRYYGMSAQACIKELGVEKICDNFISKFAYSCTGSRIVDLNALDFLNVAQGVVAPIYNFTFDPDAFVKSIGGNALIDTAVSVCRQGEEWEIGLASGRAVRCKNVVLATEARVTASLINVGPIRRPASLGSYLVKGKLKPKYASCESHFFSDSFDIIAIGGRGDGTYSVFTNREMSFDDYFESWELIKSHFWTDALYTLGNVTLQQNRGNGLYVAGDHNGLGLEPATISGIYAANCILGGGDPMKAKRA